ncbi:sensor histidine kinase [Nocardioides panacisoli]|uniref:histidine kinase n=1 Tax=Nocardioides panacisoli TaxID=627624 RepID=A0ABP7I836_9ACTN
MSTLRAGLLSRRRRAYGYAVALAGAAVLVLVLLPFRGGALNLASDVAAYLVLVVVAALVGGLGPALVASVMSAAVLNFFFTRPYRTFAIDDANNVVALTAFVVVGVMVSWLVDLSERRAAAASAAAEITAADQLRTAILAAVGHDLRSPLAAAKAVVSGLREEGVTLDEHDRRELLEAADEALDRLTGLVDNLLDLSRLQAGAMPVHLRPTALEDVVSRALDYLGVAPQSVVLAVPGELPEVVADPVLLERAVVNLVANAQRFSPDGRPPVVAAESVGGLVRLRVTDHGPGIPVDDRERVFKPFQRLGDTGTGLGLGLALSRGLVEAMGGRIDPTDTEGGGLTMVLTLPVARTGDTS